MAIALSVRSSQSAKEFRKIRPVQNASALWIRFWWHTKAYATILGIMVLLLLSLLVVFAHGTLSKTFQTTRQRFTKFINIALRSLLSLRQI